MVSSGAPVENSSGAVGEGAGGLARRPYSSTRLHDESPRRQSAGTEHCHSEWVSVNLSHKSGNQVFGASTKAFKHVDKTWNHEQKRTDYSNLMISSTWIWLNFLIMHLCNYAQQLQHTLETWNIAGLTRCFNASSWRTNVCPQTSDWGRAPTKSSAAPKPDKGVSLN